MIKKCSSRVFLGVVFSGTMLSGPAHSSNLVSDDLLTSSNETSPWQQCDTDSLAIDVSQLNQSDCAYRTTPAQAGVSYRMTCGVQVSDYASITLAFLDENDNTLEKRSTQLTERHSGANSVTLVSPENTATAAIGIYGEPGSGFQDCVLIDNAPPPEPTKGSISGGTWFDENGDSLVDESENYISGSPITLYQNGKVLRQTTTDSDGSYYFGNLDIDQCYVVNFGASDATLAGGALGGDNDALDNGSTGDICLTEEMPNIVSCDSSFVPTPPVTPPADHAICGVSWLDRDGDGAFVDGTDSILENVSVKLLDSSGKTIDELDSDQNGNYVFNQLGEGDYSVRFEAPDGYELTSGSNQPDAFSSYADSTGLTPVFSLPGDRSTAEGSACTMQSVNAGFVQLPVALPPTIANDDVIESDLGVDFTVDVVANDAPCDGAVHEVNLLGHNVPGDVHYDDAAGRFVVENTTATGTYNIEYGLRGSCGSYDTATVTVRILTPPPVVVATAPEAPICRVETGGDWRLGGVDVFHPDEYGFASEYNLYDRERKLIATLGSSDVSHKVRNGSKVYRWDLEYRNHWEIEWTARNYDYNQLSVYYVAAVENGEVSELTLCARDSISPIALDLPGKGRIQRVAGDFQVDLDADGIKESLTEWFAPTAGILISRDASGQVTGDHLFGNVEGLHADGFAKLATLDTDGDGQIAGDELASLAIWVDSNSDTVIDKDEVSDTGEHDIVSLPLQHYKYIARAQRGSGESILMEDVWFALAPIANASN